MTIASGNSITAFDYNAIQNLVGSLLGAGPTGYHQAVTSMQTTAGMQFRSSDLAALRNDINKCRRHQTGSDYSISELPSCAPGSMVRSSDLMLYQSCVNTILNNSYSAAISNMTLTASAVSVTRASVWGNNDSFTMINTEVQADFGSVDAMAAFFNTGGEIRWSMAHDANSTPQDLSWSNLLAGLGPFNIHGGNIKVSSATTVNFPLNSLTTTYKTIFTVKESASVYADNTVTVNAKLNASLTGVVVQIILNDPHANAYYDSVAAGTKATFSHLKSTVVMTGITSPTYTVITNF